MAKGNFIERRMPLFKFQNELATWKLRDQWFIDRIRYKNIF